MRSMNRKYSEFDYSAVEVISQTYMSIRRQHHFVSGRNLFFDYRIYIGSQSKMVVLKFQITRSIYIY